MEFQIEYLAILLYVYVFWRIIKLFLPKKSSDTYKETTIGGIKIVKHSGPSTKAWRRAIETANNIAGISSSKYGSVNTLHDRVAMLPRNAETLYLSVEEMDKVLEHHETDRRLGSTSSKIGSGFSYMYGNRKIELKLKGG